MTDCAASLQQARGGAVALGARPWDIYPALAEGEPRCALERVLAGVSSVTVDLYGAGRRTRKGVVFRTAEGIGIIEASEQRPVAIDEAEHVKLLHQATHDVLTGLQNRRRFSERLEEVLAAGEGGRERSALLQIDLDDFKSVNDTLGHSTGDTLLQLAAERIRDALRDGGTAYRYAGDEFAVIQYGKEQPFAAEQLAQALVDAFKPPFIINGIPLFVGASIGVAFGPQHGTESEELMKAADIALYAAKREGRGCARIFNRSMMLLLEQRENLRRNLRVALEREELHLVYQPLIQAPGSIVGFEALLRWNHPEIGPIPPSVFIPMAEADGLMEEIGRWVLEEACREAMTWPQEFNVAVNLSPAQFLGGSLTDTVAQVIDTSGIRADRIEFEITETVLLEQTVDNLDTLNTLNVLGIRISLDDFGTHYSSLAYLKNFPFDSVKIDQYFIRDLLSEKKSQTIVRSIMGLAHGLGMSVTAEGVETAGQALWLVGEGCDCLQGNFLGEAMVADSIPDFIARSSMSLHGMNEQDRF
ncbi:EAL domain-containing protein [Mesorhizobium sp. LHD-90]|uniref:putative bifunctional diguanylate cyclase/phosphodiesterase n=1 Tax=Mesorhizobium sp. LHD-90 TaxID=3071414 RepID=UPI0027E12E71|nr:EAL domain-containing protein [Mesorhizobium sp. LHD-90]MDQ6433870.1 EAL domain-containing protein [Mesorhizobium sp. LHD-90]